MDFYFYLEKTGPAKTGAAGLFPLALNCSCIYIIHTICIISLNYDVKKICVVYTYLISEIFFRNTLCKLSYYIYAHAMLFTAYVLKLATRLLLWYQSTHESLFITS